MTVRRLGVGSALLLAAAAGWALVVVRIRGVDMGAPATLGPYLGMWVTMTAAMMLPSATPVVLLVDRFSPRATPRFLTGYALSWTAIGVAAFALVEPARALGADGRHATSLLLAAAGTYQLTPLKSACLRRCRSPLSFLRAQARRGPLIAGVLHGAYCVGCCAGLMAVLFALGVMSVFWMAVVAVLIGAEKLAPHGERLARPIAFVLLATAVLLAFV